MRRVRLENLQRSMRLAQDVLAPDGRLLLAAGVTLDPLIIEALRKRGQMAVYVLDGQGDDVAPTGLLDDGLRQGTTRRVSALFALAAGLSAEQPPGGPAEWPGAALGLVQSLYEDANAIVHAIFSGDVFTGMAALKSYDEYTYEHCVETAVVGAMLGRRLGLTDTDMLHLTFGCLLHDIGKQFLRHDVINKAGPLEPPEFAHVKEHPIHGYRLVASLGLESRIPKHIAWQHHEKQDGSGYPRGLRGANRLTRFPEDLAASGRIMRLAELTAVADVYSALASDRPYRAALPPDRVAQMLLGMAGGHLNRDAVHVFLRVMPTYPVGLRVILRGAPFDGWRAVVVRVGTASLHRPTVRLLRDSGGRDRAPDDVNLVAYPDVSLVSERAVAAPPADVPAARVVRGYFLKRAPTP